MLFSPRFECDYSYFSAYQSSQLHPSTHPSIHKLYFTRNLRSAKRGPADMEGFVAAAPFPFEILFFFYLTFVNYLFALPHTYYIIILDNIIPGQELSANPFGPCEASPWTSLLQWFILKIIKRYSCVTGITLISELTKNNSSSKYVCIVKWNCNFLAWGENEF